MLIGWKRGSVGGMHWITQFEALKDEEVSKIVLVAVSFNAERSASPEVLAHSVSGCVGGVAAYVLVIR